MTIRMINVNLYTLESRRANDNNMIDITTTRYIRSKKWVPNFVMHSALLLCQSYYCHSTRLKRTGSNNKPFRVILFCEILSLHVLGYATRPLIAIITININNSYEINQTVAIYRSILFAQLTHFWSRENNYWFNYDVQSCLIIVFCWLSSNFKNLNVKKATFLYTFSNKKYFSCIFLLKYFISLI